MHLQFDDPNEALEYIEINTKRNHFPFIYNRKNEFDMQEYQELQQESSSFRSFNCDVSGNPYIIGSYQPSV